MKKLNKLTILVILTMLSNVSFADDKSRCSIYLDLYYQAMIKATDDGSGGTPSTKATDDGSGGSTGTNATDDGSGGSVGTSATDDGSGLDQYHAYLRCKYNQ